MQLRLKFPLSFLFAATLHEPKAGLGGSGAAPFKVRVPFLAGFVLNNRAVVVLVGVFSVLSKTTQVSDLHRFEFAVFGGRWSETLKAVRSATFRICAFCLFGSYRFTLWTMSPAVAGIFPRRLDESWI